MFCPQCGQRQPSNEARFCSSCGFQMYVVTELLKSGGQLVRRPSAPGQLSPRSKGLRQGVMLMLSTLVIVPIIGILGVALLGLPGEFAGAAAVICFMGGFLRMMYALLFESSEAPEPTNATAQYVPPASVPNYLGMNQTPSALPPQQSAPVNMYRAPHRFDTGEIAPPSSVTDHTTRLLDKQLDRQPDEPSKE
ncbi:MAG: zinc ribbon domain-containing protein [Pyrinomonadaceae bacterium]